MILASNSPRRLQLLKEAGISPRVHAEDIDEGIYTTKDEIFLQLPLAKAQAAIQTLEPLADEDLVIAADTTVWIDDIVLGKPADNDDAMRMLKMLSGKTHNVTTGVAICKVAAQSNEIVETHTFAETTKVTFYELSDEEIASYVESGEPLDKAGSYGIQGMGRLFVQGIEGDYFNVVGLPIARLVREIHQMQNS